MSMILMRTDLANDMRVIRLSDLTGAKVGAIIGGLHAVWSAAQTLSTDGFIRYMTAARIDRLAEVDGFAVAMVDVGWMRVAPEGVEFPDFDAYFGKSSKTRAIDRLRKNRDRKGTGKGGRPDKPRNESGQNSDKTRTESGHVRAPAHDKGKERIGTDLKESHLPPSGGEREPGESESGEPFAGKNPVPPVPVQIPSPTNPATAFQDLAPPSAPSGKPVDLGASTGKGDGIPNGFRLFWQSYPKNRRTDPDGCLALWLKQGCEANAEKVLAVFRKWLVYWEATKDPNTGKTFEPAAIKFIGKRHYETEPEAVHSPKATAAASARTTEETWSAFERLGGEGKAAVLERVYARLPGLRGLPAGTDVVRVEVFREMKREAVTT